MSEGGERMCPLCAEEMDLTDQHLKPCKCGYEICVWCWHHIIDMAEKDETEGRCPACRTPYNKEKIVGTTANCEKLVSEMSVEKKLKSHKGKSKTSEGRKQLGSVRVIQRNLVYVVGLPLNFADEDLLQRKEYFGQYGKVLKVSISRTATGAIQHFANSTCSVYITYSKEEEAIRCIQSVNGFILDGRPLKACFGTTKYCHAWLRNTPCNNPDCLYLHEVGSQEDSFTKDEVISAYTRSRVQQITGATNSMQRRSGNVLPPAADDSYNNSSAISGKLINKTAASTNQNSANGAVVSPPNSSTGRSAALPAGASWGTRSFNNQPLSTITCSNGPLKPDAGNGLVASSAEVASLIQVSSLQTATGMNLVPMEENSVSVDKTRLDNLVPANNGAKPDSFDELKSSSNSVHPATSLMQLHGADTTNSPHYLSKTVDSSLKSCGPVSENSSMDATDDIIDNMCSDFLSMGNHNYANQIKEAVTSEAPGRAVNMTNAISDTDGLSDFGLGIPTQATQVDLCETEDDLLSFDNQRLKDPEVTSGMNHLPDIFHSFHMPTLSTIPSVLNTAGGPTSVDLCGQVVDRKDNSIVSASNFPLKSGWHPYSRLNSLDANDVEYSNLFPLKEKRLLLGRYQDEVAISACNMGENSIISNILSMDFDSLDESLTSPQNLAKLLGETDKPQGSFGVSGSWKIQNSNQSRFSFAREDTKQGTHFGPSSGFLEKDFKQRPRPIGHDAPYSNSMQLGNDKFATRNNFPILGGTESDVFANNHSHISGNKLSVSRSQISAPPGFSAASRTPPPGFSSYDRADQILGTLSGNHILDAASFSRNQWQTPPSSNTFSNCDIEFMDPAILEVRHGTVPGGINSPVLDVRSSYSPQLNTFEEARIQSFLQRSVPPHSNQRINELGDGFSSITDAYGVRSRVLEQTLSNNPFSQFSHSQPRNAVASNGQWNGWNDGPGANSLGTAELLRKERLGFNKLYGGYEDSKIRMPTSGNMYNGSYGI
ncbi:hypothetical protein F511_17733 [Dorcoceras hygrometricum]|uniref:CCR4-NOT transcription complex subunit 4 n=1 Tax=Dorcoceras hygrometricum TaxID=472368 RepID=A0A2Z7B5V9_9LAMI|nr:hypothetical protein F511_17733 [Dorcoceras hygrometricum]